jgi:beta-glucosidase
LADSDAEASARALKAGLDTDEGCIDMHSKGLREALRLGLIALEDIDRAARRVLALKFRLGLFEDPYMKTGKAVEICSAKPHREIALETARQSMTLLSNKNEALPLKGVKRLP